jgi:hypothetical protein
MTDPRRRGGERRSNARAKPQEGEREREREHQKTRSFTKK